MKPFSLRGLGGLPGASFEFSMSIGELLDDYVEDADVELFAALRALPESVAARACLALGRWDEARGHDRAPVTLEQLQARTAAVAQAEGEEALLDAEALQALLRLLQGDARGPVETLWLAYYPDDSGCWGIGESEAEARENAVALRRIDGEPPSGWEAWEAALDVVQICGVQRVLRAVLADLNSAECVPRRWGGAGCES